MRATVPFETRTQKVPFGWNEACPLQAVTRTERSGERHEHALPDIVWGDMSCLEIRDCNGAPILSVTITAGEAGYLIEVPNAGGPTDIKVVVGH